jgi:glycosyltransferase involved in cell wall biosynthesis
MTSSSKELRHNDSTEHKNRPVMVYNDPHPVHEQMATAIGATLIPSDKGGFVSRLKSAITSSYKTPIILEGGQPLVEGGLVKLLHRTDSPVILLAADETQQNIYEGLEYYSRKETLAHKVSHRFLDGVIAVSEDVKEYTLPLVDCPVRVAEPFMMPEMYRHLGSLSPEVSGKRILTVGENRPSNGHDILREAWEDIAEKHPDATVDFVGHDTSDVEEGDGVGAHGFVSKDELLSMYARASVFVHPARAGANPVVVMEAMRAGLPVITTYNTGASSRIESLTPGLTCEDDPQSIADTVDWYFQQDREWKQKASDRLIVKADHYRPGKGRKRFKRVYERLIDQI